MAAVTVYLVGAGPGDPGLLTLRGAELLALADVIVHDRLSAPELLDLAPADAERVDVGKAPRRHRMAQDEITALLVARGRLGQTVVRLKGGDPFVFARGSEEAQALADADVAYEVVPGITSAIAAPAYAGIPVTQRFSSTSFTVVTGHEDPSVPNRAGTVDWDAVARVGGTIVVLMGVGRWPAIAAALLAAGRDPDTPAAAVQWGSRPNQQSTRATLATLGDHALASPSVIVIGPVAAKDLSWFEQRPLFGRSVVVTRARAQASALSDRLRALGATVVEAPVIEMAAPVDGGTGLARAMGAVGDVDWLVLTSANGVTAAFEHLVDARALAGVRVAAVGSATAAALADRGVVADLVPERFVAESLLDAFPPPPRPAARVLLATAAGARSVLPDGLRRAGWHVEAVDAYRTVAAAPDEATMALIAAADAVTFTSSSTVTNLCAAVGAAGLPATVVAIGPITSATARAQGLSVAAEADPHTIKGLVDVLVAEVGRASGRPES